MSKKPIAAYEDYLDKKAVMTTEENEAREMQDIKYLLTGFDNVDVTEILIEILVSKGVVSVKDFKRVLEK